MIVFEHVRSRALAFLNMKVHFSVRARTLKWTGSESRFPITVVKILLVQKLGKKRIYCMGLHALPVFTRYHGYSKREEGSPTSGKDSSIFIARETNHGAGFSSS